MEWLVTYNKNKSVKIDDIPVFEYVDFYDDVCEKLTNTSMHIASYFAHPTDSAMVFYCLLLDDDSGEVHVASHHYDYYGEHKLQSIAAVHPQLHVFEREITELYGIKFANSPWDKPLRYPHNRKSKKKTINNYPFYNIKGPTLHEVNVGPIHAGIIEPGVFRFICNGERVLHLEIVLGYQHKGVERLMVSTNNRLRQTVLSESIAGDTVVGHTTAYCTILEKFTDGFEPSVRLNSERAVALELERIAVHIADVGALCTDIGYQLGQVASEALRTIIINSTQYWSGNRFAKGLIRPLGSNFAMDGRVAEEILKNVGEVRHRFHEVREDLKSTPSLLSRFEGCGSLNSSQLQNIGAVGVAARAGGLQRDVRKSHPMGAWVELLEHKPEMKEYGDIMDRMLLRTKEVSQSSDYIFELLRNIIPDTKSITTKPNYNSKLTPSSLAFSLVEGWRGEICHVALTDKEGQIECYKIKDPSMHNWLALALTVRGEGISDFPICNKSFSLSYSGHDL